MVTFPIESPAGATAIKPGSPKAFATIAEPNTVVMVNDISEKGLFIRL
jgi:hypothetical protein